MASASAVLTAARIIGMIVGLAAVNSWGISEFQATRASDPVPLPSFGMSLAEYLDKLGAWEQINVQVILGILSDFFFIGAVACLLAVIPSMMLLGRKSDNLL